MFILFLYVTKRNMMEYTIYIYIYLQETLWFPTMQQVFPSHALIDDQRNHSRFAVCLVWWFRHLSGRPFYPCMRRESHACNQRICWRFFFPCLFGFLLGNLSGPCCSFSSFHQCFRRVPWIWLALTDLSSTTSGPWGFKFSQHISDT